MKRLLMLIPLVLLCCLAVGCISRDYVAPTDVEADIQAIKDSVAELEAAVNMGDVDKIMSFYADNAVRIPPNEPALIGKEAIQRLSRQAADEFDLQEVYEVKNVKISGDMAVAHIAWSSTVTIKASGETVNPKGNGMRVYERQSDGDWKCIYSIWSDETLVHPE